ncbi:MAG: hypothetical protein DRP71_01805 [Verrucomicrobia bacterium]|nr:MAG: hypothetical protein DRP71_01805 [Verrucomicrobiota bacterium]
MKMKANREMRCKFVSLAGACALLFSMATASADTQWYKGNTHAHTVLCGHADSSPEAVAKWYHDHGYQFLILSEHNIFIDPESVELPEDRREDFILIPGEEITGHKHVHSTAVNVHRLIDWTFESEVVSEIIQDHLDRTRDAGGEHILNHPTYRYAVTSEDMKQVSGLRLFELHNGHPNTVQHAHEVDSGFVTTEDMWDDMLTSGVAVYGVSSDDTHTLKEWNCEASNPGRGWVMVRSPELTADSITEALRSGEFYATNGVVLSRINRTEEVFQVEVDEKATLEALESPYVIGYRRSEASGGTLIEFVGPGGRVLKHVHARRGSYAIQADDAYVRCRVTFTRRAGAGYEQFFAWAQPVFTDGRLEPVPSTGGAPIGD